MPIALAFACPGCGLPVEVPLDPARTSAPCPACGRETPFPEAAALAPGRLPAACPVCGSDDLYVQRDFNRALGLAIAGVGLVLGPFTSWISTVVAIAVDALLYVTVPLVAVCYACNAQLRGFRKDEAPEAFDIAVHDAYKFGKRFPPRRDVAVAGPLARRLALEGAAPRVAPGAPPTSPPAPPPSAPPP
jgi:hypothetical protein